MNIDVKDLPPDRRIKRLGGTALADPGIANQVANGPALILGKSDGAFGCLGIANIANARHGDPASINYVTADRFQVGKSPTHGDDGAFTSHAQEMARPIPRPPPVMIIAEDLYLLIMNYRSGGIEWDILIVQRSLENLGNSSIIGN